MVLLTRVFLTLFLVLAVSGCPSGGDSTAPVSDGPADQQPADPGGDPVTPAPGPASEQRIIFSADLTVPGVDQIHSMRVDGSDLKQIAPERPGVEPDLSPDGTRIAYSISNIRIMDSQDGSGDTILTFPDIAGGSYDTFPAFSPDGTEIAFVRFAPLNAPAIYKVRIADQAETFVTAAATATNWDVFGLDWSPDGATLLWGAWDPLGVGTFSAIKLFSAPADGTRAGVYLVDGSEPAYRPDGGAFAYVSSIGELTIANLGAVGGVRIAKGSQPAWSPDGSRVIYQAHKRAGLTIYNAADASLTALLDMQGKNARGMDWGVVR